MTETVDLVCHLIATFSGFYHNRKKVSNASPGLVFICPSVIGRMNRKLVRKQR